MCADAMKDKKNICSAAARKSERVIKTLSMQFGVQ